MDNASDIGQHLREALTLLEGGSNKKSKPHPPSRRRVRGTEEAWEVCKEMSQLEQEELWVMVLNNSLELLGMVKLYRGNTSSAIVRPAEVFREAVRLGATSIAIAHNHPGGDPRPSTEDLEITKAIVAAGKILDIPLLDHLVIGRQSHTSIIGQRLIDSEGWKNPPQISGTQRARWLGHIEL